MASPNNEIPYELYENGCRPSIDECLLQICSLTEGVHIVMGVPWAATVPITAVSVMAGRRAPLLTHAYT